MQKSEDRLDDISMEIVGAFGAFASSLPIEVNRSRGRLLHGHDLREPSKVEQGLPELISLLHVPKLRRLFSHLSMGWIRVPHNVEPLCPNDPPAASSASLKEAP